MRRSLGSNVLKTVSDSEPIGNKKVTRKGKKPQKQLTDSLQLVMLIPEGLDMAMTVNRAFNSDSDPETRYYTRSKKRQKLSIPESSISSKATASEDDEYDIEWPETFDADAAFPPLAAPMSDSEPGSPAKLPTPSKPRLSLANLEESCDASMKKMDELYSGFGALHHISQTPWSFITPQAVPLDFLPPAAPPAPLAPPALPVPPGLPTLPVALAPPTLATDAVLPALPA
ncbi:hypothetical protein JB92DRAFT_2829826 [Gautieria morchelliformis]|nr:hypothetical protein JB92DRAFT_2829826 [Gautieria morchelliformis]